MLQTWTAIETRTRRKDVIALNAIRRRRVYNSVGNHVRACLIWTASSDKSRKVRLGAQVYFALWSATIFASNSYVITTSGPCWKMSYLRKSGQESWKYRVFLLFRYCLRLGVDIAGRWFSCNFANHRPDFFYRGTTVDFGDVCLPRVPFCRFGLGPGDSVVLCEKAPDTTSICCVGCFCTRLRPSFLALIATLQSSLHQMVLCFWYLLCFRGWCYCYVNESIRKFVIGSSALQILSVPSSKAAWCENAAHSALWSIQVGLENDGEGMSVVIIIV